MVDGVPGELGAAAALVDVGGEHDHEQALLRRVEEVPEEVAVGVPLLVWHHARPGRRPVQTGLAPEVDHDVVGPRPERVDPGAPADELAGGLPRPRRDLGGVELCGARIRPIGQVAGSSTGLAVW